MSATHRRVEQTKDELADAIASRLVVVIAEAIAARGVAHLVLTGGSMGSATLEALRRHGAEDVDWQRVHLWWGDERFLPAGDPERNETQARVALLDHVAIPEANVHPMAADGGIFAGDLEGAAAAYAQTLARYAPQGAEVAVPSFDVVMLGMGPDSHVASLFPGHEQTTIDDATVTCEKASPKPPPQRLTLTFPALCSGAEVWLMIAGADKAEAVREASASSDPTAHPASGVHGTRTTVWWLDAAAAG